MSITLQSVIQAIEEVAPRCYQESYDNSGLLVGDPQRKINKALVALDCTEAVLQEAIQGGFPLIIVHHPVILSGIKSLTGKNMVERIVIKAIQKNIAIYACHTNLDNMQQGVNAKIASKLGLKKCRILDPKPQTLQHLYTYVPKNAAEEVRKAVCDAGAGQIGDYSQCSFLLDGQGTFQAEDGATPYVGQLGQLHYEQETKLEWVVPIHSSAAALKALQASHPYEEIAYGLTELKNTNSRIGAGMIGELDTALSQQDFLKLVKRKMKANGIRYTAFDQRPIQKVAFCGGSGSFLLKHAIQAGADAFITADFKYHQFFEVENRLLLADIGHFESEQFTSEIFSEILSKKFPSFAVHLTSVDTNPISYF